MVRLLLIAGCLLLCARTTVSLRLRRTAAGTAGQLASRDLAGLGEAEKQAGVIAMEERDAVQAFPQPSSSSSSTDDTTASGGVDAGADADASSSAADGDSSSSSDADAGPPPEVEKLNAVTKELLRNLVVADAILTHQSVQLQTVRSHGSLRQSLDDLDGVLDTLRDDTQRGLVALQQNARRTATGVREINVLQEKYQASADSMAKLCAEAKAKMRQSDAVLTPAAASLGGTAREVRRDRSRPLSPPLPLCSLHEHPAYERSSVLRDARPAPPRRPSCMREVLSPTLGTRS